MNPLIEITATFGTERFRRGDFFIASAHLHSPAENGVPPNGSSSAMRQQITIKGESSPDENELKTLATYRFYGRWEDHAKHGRAFACQTFVRAQPHGQAGITRYLQEAPGIGLAISRALWDKFGSDAVRICREAPDVVVAAGVGLNLEKARLAAAYLAEQVALENCTIALTDPLGGRGFPRGTARLAVKKWGNRSAEIIRRNPYALMAFRGCGFARTDAMYLDLGLPAAKLKRQALCAWYELASDTEGHTWYPIDKAARGITAKVGGAEVEPVKAIGLARRHGIIATRRDPANGDLYCAEGKKARQEAKLSAYIAAGCTEPPHWPGLHTHHFDRLTDHQREQLAHATRGTIGILAGSPGTGKTFTVAALARAIIDRHGEDAIQVCCPTGKAAVRCTEAMRAAGVQLEAATIHRTLKVASAADDTGGGWAFEHDELNPLDCQFLIVDEASMVGTGLASSLCVARARGTCVLLVGDPGQLPPVEHGAPLRDLMSWGLGGGPLGVGYLTEIKRNAGTIVTACAAIRDGRHWQTDLTLEPDTGHNLKVLPAGNGPHAVEKIVSVIRSVREAGLCDPIWDCQVIVAVNAKSPLGRKALNTRLQAELNPGGETVAGCPFRVNDKIVCLKNSLVPAAVDGEGDSSDGKWAVANGEQARVVAVEERRVIAELQNPTRRIAIPRGKRDDGGNGGNGGNGESESSSNTGCDFDLAYAISCHKSQGSEWPVVIVAIDDYPGARWVCSREWIYTAISRARSVCLLVGKRSTADGFCRRQALSLRKTFLRELLGEDFVRLTVDAAGGR